MYREFSRCIFGRVSAEPETWDLNMRTRKRFNVGPRTGEVGAEVMSELSARKGTNGDRWIQTRGMVGDHGSNFLV